MKRRGYCPIRTAQRFRADKVASEDVKARTSPLDFYTRAVGPLSGRGTWRSARCPFHSPDRHPSLRINIQSGAFRCMSCGVHGGDAITFLMRRDGLSFRDALRALAAGDYV